MLSGAGRVGRRPVLGAPSIANVPLDDLTFVVSPFWVISTMTPSEIFKPARTQAACQCARPSEVSALSGPCQPQSWDRAGPHTRAAAAALLGRDQHSSQRGG